jgi:hypothetical protein
MDMVAARHDEVGDRFNKLKVVETPFKQRGNHCKPDLHRILVLSTGPLLETGSLFPYW